ncbi:MAG TPA: hypothetical protein VGO47_03885 [Chlamydiales bacterium]|nr:hypothetical protein [Chlamydiales bacterium]
MTARANAVLKPSMGQDNGTHEPRPPFTFETFKAALVNWIVTDDQVCIASFA